jgi:two-component system sensor histidine kinase EvgS
VARWLGALILLLSAIHVAAQRIPGTTASPPTLPLLTDEERSWLRAQPALRVATKTEWAPIDVYTYEGQFRGLSGDYLALIAQRLDLRLEFKASPTLADALAAVQRGEADLVPSLSRTPAREAFLAFSRPYLDVPNVYVTRSDVTGVGNGQSMQGLRVAVEKGYAVASLIRERHPRAVIVEVADSASALRAVSDRRADVYLGALPTTSFLVERLLLSNLEVRDSWQSSLSSLHFALPKSQTRLLELMNRALASITLVERQEIHRRWMPLRSLLVEPAPPLALSQAEERFIASLPALRVGYELDFRPYTLQTQDGQLSGAASDYLRLVADKASLRLASPQAGTWTDIYQRARRGEIDLLVAVAANAEREKEFIFIGPWVSTPNVLVTPLNAAPVLTLAQYASRRVAVLRDGQTAYLMRKLHPYVRLVDVDSRDGLLAAVANGEADAALVNVTFAAPALSQGLGAALRMAAFFPELNSDLYFAVRRDQSALADILQRSLASVSESERAAIASRWAVLPITDESGVQARAALFRILPLLVGTVVALGVSLVWGWRLRLSVARRREAEREAAQARDRAEALALQRQAFLAEASHEIRTPVNAVCGALDLLRQEPLLPRAEELAVLAQRSAQTLSEYVNNLLDLSKSDSGQLHLVLQADSLRSTLAAAVQAVEPLARSRRIDVRLLVDPGVAGHHRFDAFRLRQVVVNLLSNAVKFSDEEQEVVLAANAATTTTDVQAVTIEVRDRGIGIEPAQLKQLFQPYAQAGITELHRNGGTGLGLVLCRRLMDAMGGTIDLEPNDGKGTRAVLSLSLPVEDEPSGLKSTTVTDGRALRVLLAEDDRVQQIILETILVRLGCQVDVAGDGEAAWAMWRIHRHPLVITDLQMPRLDGFALAQRLQQAARSEVLTIVGTSADLDDEDRARACGVSRLLSKPVCPDQIHEVLREAISRVSLESVGSVNAP